MEQLSRELECSVDYLVNEAIRSYLRQRQVVPAEPAASPRIPLGALEIEYEGRRYPVNKEYFLIGRSPGTCDLTIPHSVISRKHLAIEFLDGQYYAVDLGSANGVEHQGTPIARRALCDGDELSLSGQTLRFFFRSLP
jgi:pSer/pThr/pTyr-binding forkhead associated (FHA) protein